MLVSDFNYYLPPDRIALYPPRQRGQAKLLVLYRQTGEIEHRSYEQIVDYLSAGDVVVLNNTKVIKARLIVRKSDGRKMELLLLERHGEDDHWCQQAIFRGKLRAGEELEINNSQIMVLRISNQGIADLEAKEDLYQLAQKYGEIPLPPYLHRKAGTTDRYRYQTVFAKKVGSVAAPTASLNMTKELIRRLEQAGIKIVFVTLHVGLGTFMPIKTIRIEDHRMHQEYFSVPKNTVKQIRRAKLEGKRIVAVGTTSARTLEFAADKLLSGRKVEATAGEADIFIYPGFRFRVVDALVTNYHAPKTTVLMLAAAFAGWEYLEKAYQEALAHDYKFLSYGDSMLIL